MKHKKITCKEYGANLTLKTLRYSHKCSKLEDIEIKPGPKAKSKLKPFLVKQHKHKMKL